MALLPGQWVGKTIPFLATRQPIHRWSWRLRCVSRPHGIIQLGLLFLIATPVAHVAFTIFVFAEKHDRM
jgi:hypothetical protein